ncbi:hypothetical protein L596_018600 [Steinernema carpocapsae]|uniref:Uncharacterized protein n=1 Tax=Steinernema carpocapsae TaxID=34508 RepID=A0A4U5N5Z3_STECR|nr:hypothetical protein L596_018600 [Steinernema carpocapsae]
MADLDTVGAEEAQQLEFYQVALLSAGVLLFLVAHRLVRSKAFFYVAGLIMGEFFSVFLLVYIMFKLVPMKLSTATTGTVIAGYAVSSYVMYMMWDFLWSMIVAYQTYILHYMSVTAVISMLFCYWKGPPTNPRTQDIMQWTVQLISTLAIYLSMHDRFFALTVISLLLIYVFVRSMRGRSLSK